MVFRQFFPLRNERSFCFSYVAAVAYAEDSSTFAVLALLPESIMQFQEVGRDGIIVVFDVNDPSPVKTWSVKKVKFSQFRN